MASQEPTQRLTQEVLDPRRVGLNNSGLNEKDVADVLAILHPASPGAMKIVEDMAEDRKEHVLFRNQYDSFDEFEENIEEQETIIINPTNAYPSVSRAGADLCLRMSSKLKTPSLGFVFGRNPMTSDVVLGVDSGKRISNQHFRIYLNADAILMLEDMSTNGTLVDEVLLRNRDPRFNKVRMLGSGSIICIQNVNDNEIIKFIVRIPSRVSHLERFHDNLRGFLTKCADNPDTLKGALQRLNKQGAGPTMKWDGGDRYNIIGLLGKGAFATVHQLATKIDGTLLAAKELEKRRFMKNGQLDKKIDNEMKIMSDLRHPNIVDYVEYHDQGDFLYIIMEFVRFGDLQGYLNQNGPMEEQFVRQMAQQILSALNYLHRMKITHRDIKPDNILISDIDNFTVKLSDFGLSKVVKHDETFLKTFCGTLLYCAPEVFPDFDGTRTKGTKRRRSAKQQYHSYSSSVDIWSFAAVIWYALCGKPPFEGIADATGRAMYNNIMSTQLDATPLREKKVSEACIDLLFKMLQTDPSLRPTDRECLNHPWLKDGAVVPNDPVLQSIVEEDESEGAGEQLSQLSIQEEVPESDDEFDDDLLEDAEFERLISNRQSKRIRVDPLVPRHHHRENTIDSSAEPSFHAEHFASHDQVDESFKLMEMPSNRPRLFGEIGKSALQSSGILTVHANEALSKETSSGEVLPDHVFPDQVALSSQDGTRDDLEAGKPSESQLQGIFSSPSLLGAESMVRDLNMASPHSPVSGAHSPIEPATPRTPDVPQHNSLEQHTDPSQASEPTPKAKPPTLTRQISIPRTASFYYDPYDPSTHNLKYASEVSGIDFLGGEVISHGSVTDEEIAQRGRMVPDTMRFSTENGDSSVSGSAAASTDVSANGSMTESHEKYGVEGVPTLPAQLDIKPPPKRLGKLTSTADSFTPGLTLMIDRNRTTWGRQLNNTLVYENSNDIRIPKTAFLIFWYSSDADSGTVDDLSQQGKDWTSLSSLHTGIFTSATSGISINGKHLRKKDDKGRALYGNLHNGDVIQIFHDPHGTECLKFKCELYHGSGKEPRRPGEAFDIRTGVKLADS
ncbi:hypothetical protein B0J11DRAFT_580894 [Dendryphion nanum]|uniref:Pkinase-domain-containing protein n=1 Tax=Dendryphion nanum TaxID=256645 RepID=A0A9P9DSC6_9PLEO|nr:hypothetical protein B0J11DRAFT_580894 [Dendryphion nanum]